MDDGVDGGDACMEQWMGLMLGVMATTLAVV